MRHVIVGIVDVGSNTVRLLVADVVGRSVEQLRRERHYVRLGDDVHAAGRIRTKKLQEAADVARKLVRTARKSGAERVESIVTAPGRQAENGDELVRLLRKRTDAPVVQLTGEDEGRLAWEGAVARAESLPDVVGVVDLGGGSFELAVGTPGGGPSWVESVDAGALRVTRDLLGGDPPSAKKVARARERITELVGALDPPRPDGVLAVGGTARAIGRIVGKRYGERELQELTDTLTRKPAAKIAEPHGVTPERAHTLLGGTLVLAEIARRLDRELEVGRGGLREGAALALARQEAAVA
jgi:exopolyphosphatase / guanosine-5'-triphosphate,3'-diphosphate pyrophosphatase